MLSCFAEPGVVLQLKHQLSLQNLVLPLLECQQADCGCSKLLSSALTCYFSFPSWHPLTLLPWSCWFPAALMAFLDWAHCLQMPATSLLLSSRFARQVSHHGTVWGLGDSCWGTERGGRAGLYCLAACWVKPAGLTRKRKGKRLLATISFFSQFSLCAFKEWRSRLNASISCASVSRERNPRWGSVNVPLLNSQQCWPTIAGLCNEFPQPFQTSSCVWEHQPRVCVVMS